MERKNYVLRDRLLRSRPMTSIPMSWFILILSIMGCVKFSTGTELLQLGQINVMVLTDVHSWVAGHSRHEPQNNANYGDVLSFYEHLRDKCHEEEKDLFFVMNGDFIDGTGLTTNPPTHLIPILQQMPWDAINIGNHELYRNSTIEFITEPGGFVDSWDGRYLTSNVLLSETGSPIGERYKFLNAHFSNQTILTFGFLYDFERNCRMTEVEKVEEVVQSDWFYNVTSKKEGDFDAIMVLAHMGHSDPLLEVILSRVREICGDDMPVQFITGHTHIRANNPLDYYSSSFEAGRYLDTIGLVSFPTTDSNSTITNSTTTSPSNEPSISSQPSTVPSGQPSISFFPSVSKQPSISPLPTTLYEPSTYPSISSSPTVVTSSQPSITIHSDFKHLFIDTSVELMKELVGKKTLRTPNGTALSNFIMNTEEELGLSQILGCSPATYNSKSGLQKSDSLWGLYTKHVVPTQLFSLYTGNNNIFIAGSGAFRYDLFEGNVTLDDLISTSPFNDTIYLVDDKSKGEDIITALGKPNYVHPNSNSELPKLVITGAENLLKNRDANFRVFTDEFNLDYITEKLSIKEKKIEPKEVVDVTTGIIWKEFINNTWPCPRIEPEEKEEEKPRNFIEAITEYFETFTALKVTAFILTFIIIFFFGWMFICRSHSKSMFSYSDSDSGSDLSMLDDLSVEEFSSETSQNSSVYMPRVFGGGGLPRKSYQSFHPPDSDII